MYKCLQNNLIPYYVDTRGKEHKLSQRLIKTNPSAYLPHHYTMSVYLDANLEIRGAGYQILMSLVDQLKKNRNTALYCFAHPKRKSIFQEADAVRRYKLETIENLYKMFNEFYTHDFKDNIGLTETNCLIRKHAPLAAFHKDWNKCVTLSLIHI